MFVFFVLHAASSGDTLSPSEIAVSLGCNPHCSKILTPVCASDNQDYDNQCILDLAACLSPEKNLVKVSDGKCRAGRQAAEEESAEKGEESTEEGEESAEKGEEEEEEKKKGDKIN